MTVQVIGAGMAGLLAARMLADLEPQVLERQATLPNNHHAVLRFRTEAVSLATNIPFRKVTVLKAVLGAKNPVADACAYALKVTGKLQPRSIINTSTAERYIAPSDFISRLAAGVQIEYQQTVKSLEDLRASVKENVPVISTMPMPALMNLLGYPHRRGMQLKSTPGWNISVELPPEWSADVFATIYCPSEVIPWYRGSLTGDRLVLEGVGELPDSPEACVANACKAFGLPVTQPFFTVHHSQYQKLAEPRPEDREAAKQFIVWATTEHRIFSLGRFATWRPGLLLDDVVNDVRVIRRLIEGEGFYDARLRGKA